MRSYDTVVVGLGAMGSAAIYQLAKRGNRVLGIDQYAPPHINGSSHGETRITRQAIGEGEAYTPLALRSHEIWRDLEARTGQSLLTVTGGLIISPAVGRNIVHGKADFLQQTIDSANKYQIAHELLNGQQIRERFPQFLTKDDDHGYFEIGAGFLRPERCVKVQLDLAEAQGAEIRTSEKVHLVIKDGDGVRIVTDDAEYFADKAIIAAGPWINEFLGPAYQGVFKVFRQTLFWFAVNRGEEFSPERFPIFIWDLGKGNDMYGFPSVDNGMSIKIATEKYTDPTTPEFVDRIVTPDEANDMYSLRVGPYIGGVTSNCVDSITCLYTVTPDSNFVIDSLPDTPQIIAASPCSGHGFKHSAAIGEILAQLVVDGKSSLDISSFSISRMLNGRESNGTEA
jgi:sarcosine oxidase